MENEEWRVVPGYENRYQANIRGEIKRLEYQKPHWPNGISTFPEKLLTPNLGIRGYLTVRVTRGGKSKTTAVHRLIAITFIPNPENKRTVNHKNGIKTDNRVENLEWATSAENNRHAFSTGLMNPTKGEKHSSAKLTEAQVMEIRNSKNIPRKILCEKYSMSRSAIDSVLNRETWRHI